MGIFKKNEMVPAKPCIHVKLVRQEAGKMTIERLNITNDEAGTYSVGLDQIKISSNPYLDMGGMVVTKDDFLHIYEMKMKRLGETGGEADE